MSASLLSPRILTVVMCLQNTSFFLPELMYGYDSGRWDVKHCDTFEPIDKPGFKHDCLICKDPRKTHPGPGGYAIGAPPYTEEGMAYL
ncbi:hypothetical protein M5689_009490 [Euphorbia peplus]|nr:hypothetical protein M5689_009490 [Euphorbia peplus]